MDSNFRITPPFFEFGPKAYLYGQKALDFALFADEVSEKYQVSIIITPQTVDISRIANATRSLLVFAQHMDALPIGRGVGSILPEAVKEAGAVGVLLNHAERPLTKEVIQRAILRADEVGLASMVCAGSPGDLVMIAKMNPNIILAESPELIGTGKRKRSDQGAIQIINANVWKINPEIRVLHGAGIRDEHDVYEIIALGAQATGSTSGILQAENPFAMLEAMIWAVREAWDKTH